MLVSLLNVSSLVVPAGAFSMAIPMRATPKDQLATSSHQHHQLLRVKRDFGDPWRDIVLDAWVPKDGADELSDVRLWWLESNRDDIRKPFGKKTRKRVTVGYKRRAADEWQVSFGAGSRKFVFEVTLDAAGRPAVYGDVRVGRKKIDDCKVESARLYANKVLDVTVGLDRLEVSCTDARGRRHVGNLRRSS